MFNNTFEYKIITTIKDDSGNFILIKAIINSVEYVLGNIYSPNRDDPTFFTNIQTLLYNLDATNLIIGGDWNLLLNPSMDGLNYRTVNNINAKKEVDNLIVKYNLSDIWRQLHPNSKRYTWHKKINSRIVQQGRLDFFLISEHLIDNNVKSSIIPGYRSDHSFILTEINPSKRNKIKTFWKFNNQLLKDPNYIKAVQDVIKKVKLDYMSLVYEVENLNDVENYQSRIDDQLFLEVLMMEIRSETLRFAARRKKTEQTEEIKLIADIENLENNITLNAEELEIKKASLENIRKNKLIGSLIRARANWLEHGEKPSKYFCNLENRHFVSKRMNRIINKHGKELTKDEEIIDETKSFYEALYSYHPSDIVGLQENNLATSVESKLPEEVALELEGEISIQELYHCLRNMKNNKSPGTDGFTVEFYKFFWKDIKSIILNSLNGAFRSGLLSTMQREGVITCIPKGNKPKEFLKNWRPICLLNVVYKLCSGCIAHRLKRVLPLIINSDQTGFIKQRFVGDNIRLVYDAIHHINNKNKKGILLLIDFEKAFDSLSWDFIRETLSIFNFKQDIKKWISIFLTDIKSCVIVNNKVSNWFAIKRGCRQGDPISPYIFVICAEILATMVRKNPNIKGISLGVTEVKISQYADDTSLFLDGSKESFEYCIKTILEYAKYSGLNMNFEKTKVICLGTLKNNDIKYMSSLPLEWNPETFMVLGIELNSNLKNLMSINLERKITEMENTMKVWTNRNLTPLGRITVLKSLIISKITHILTTLPSENSIIIKEIEKLCFKFVWRGKPDLIKRRRSYNKIKEGGLNMIDLEAFQTSLRLTWLRRLFGDVDSAWKTIILNECKPIKDIKYYGSLYCKKCMESTSNKFWLNVLHDYRYYCNNFDKISGINISQQPIFHNPRFKIASDLVGCRKLQEAGIFFIDQIFSIEEKRIYTREEIKAKYDIAIDFISFNNIEKGIEIITMYENENRIYSRIGKNNVSCYMDNILSTEKGTQNIYKVLLPTNEYSHLDERWRKEGIENIDWHKVYKIIDKSLPCTKLKWIQFRIVNKIITTNKSISKFNPGQTPLCTFCKSADETIIHLFYDCHKVREFWEEFQNRMNLKCPDVRFENIPKQVILLGTATNFYTTPVFDLILILAKLYIYRQKVSVKNFYVESFVEDIKMFYLAETFKATTEGTKHIHDVKWANFLPLFPL